MKRLFALIAVLSVSVPAIAATGRGRTSMANQMDARVSVTHKAINNTVATKAAVADNTVVAAEPEPTPEVIKEEEKPKDMREREKAACIQNNIGVGATFVWASKYSNTANYNSMIEDIEFPENNVCFVKVGLKSSDARIDISDVPTKYFVMGENITCGQWANADTLKQRILDAKKKGRTWATVGGAVAGAGIGVGAMELFGNKLIGGAVEGQADMEGTELLCSQMKVLKQEKSSKYNDIRAALVELQKACEETKWSDTNPMPDACSPSKEDKDAFRGFDYKTLLSC